LRAFVSGCRIVPRAARTFVLPMEDVCTAKLRWTREEIVRAMQHHQRLKIRRGVVFIMKIFAGVLLLFIGLLLLAWLFLPSTSRPPIFAIVILVAFSSYWLTFDLLNTWFWGRGFNKRRDANIEISWRFSDTEITMQTALGTATVSWKSFLKIVETNDG